MSFKPKGIDVSHITNLQSRTDQKIRGDDWCKINGHKKIKCRDGYFCGNCLKDLDKDGNELPEKSDDRANGQ